MNKNKYWIITILVAIVILTVILPMSREENTKVIKIGWIGPQTGPTAVLGMDSATAAQIAVDEINKNGGISNKKIELYIEDDQYDTKKSVSAYRKLVDVNDVKIIIVNTYSSVFALAKQAEKDNVILIDPLDCNNEIANLSENMFCLATDSESLARVLSNTANERGFKKVGLLYFNSDLFMPLVQKVFSQTYKGDIVLSESYVAGTRDFKTQISKMISDKADAMVLLGYDETGNAMKQARDLGFKGQFLTTGTVTSPPLQAAAQGKAEGTLLAFWGVNKNDKNVIAFDTEFKRRQSRPPILDLATYPTYDTVKVLIYAIEKANNDSVKSIKSELLKIKNFKGLTGEISFNENGSMLIPEKLFLLTNGMVVPQ